MTFLNHDLRRRLRHLLYTAIALLITISLIIKWRQPYDRISKSSLDLQDSRESVEKAFVVASMKKDDTSWIEKNFPDWDLIRYIVDDPGAKYTVMANKGRESMVYLSFIIDFYDRLPDLTVFMHSQRYQWHNDDPLYDGVVMLSNLQIPYLLTQGYTNLRCVWTIGCPNELKFSPPQPIPLKPTTQSEYPTAFQKLFPNLTLPPSIGVACCAQFAVTRNTIHSRSREEYLSYRQFLLDTLLDSDISGRIFEYSWHFIFGKEMTHCPNAKLCYCEVFGICNLSCDEMRCGERWPYPPFSTLPEGWPIMGWQGERRDEEELARMRKVSMVS